MRSGMERCRAHLNCTASSHFAQSNRCCCCCRQTNITPRIPTHRYSIAVLVVEAIGVSALIPYAFANLRPTLPVEEPERKENEDPITWAEFGVRDK